MSEVKYTEQHEWIRAEGEEGVIGISDYAADQLGDVVFVDLPEIGKVVNQFEELAVVESVKAASEIYAPVSGEVIAVNEALTDDPSLVNAEPGGKGWMVRLKVKDAGEFAKLMPEDKYAEFIKSLD